MDAFFNPRRVVICYSLGRKPVDEMRYIIIEPSQRVKLLFAGIMILCRPLRGLSVRMTQCHGFTPEAKLFHSLREFKPRILGMLY